MRTLRLAFSRIVTYFSENKIIFILYFIGTIACILSMIYFYGNILVYKTGTNENDIVFRRYEITFRKPVEVTAETIEKLKDFEQGYEIQDMILSAVLDENGNEYIDFTETAPAFYLDEPKEYNAIVVEAYLNNNNNFMYNPKSNIFTDEQLKQNVTAAPKGKNGSIKINGQDFKIIKNEQVVSYNIPMQSYLDSGIKTCNITICVSERFSRNKMSRYIDFLNNFCDENYSDVGKKMYDPGWAYGSEDNAVQHQIAWIIGIFIVSLISFMFLLKYLMDSSRRENSVLMMVGAKRKHIILINFLENITLAIISIVIAISVHILAYDCVFKKVNMYENITYYVQDYVIIALLALGLSIIVQIPFVITYWSKNVRNIKEGSK